MKQNVTRACFAAALSLCVPVHLISPAAAFPASPMKAELMHSPLQNLLIEVQGRGGHGGGHGGGLGGGLGGGGRGGGFGGGGLGGGGRGFGGGGGFGGAPAFGGGGFRGPAIGGGGFGPRPGFGALAPRGGFYGQGPGARPGVNRQLAPMGRPQITGPLGVRRGDQIRPVGQARQPRGQIREGYYRGHKGDRHHRPGYRWRNGWWYPAAAFAGGLYWNDYWPYYNDVYPVDGGASPSSHAQWCYGRYRSYRAYDNTFQPYNGRRQQCQSPYWP
jgi:hypothetical protein